MHSNDDANDQRERIPQLAPGWAAEDIVLTPAEGFLISRIDGQTPWAMLRQIGGLSPEQVDDYLDRWSEAGAIRFIEKRAASPGGREELDIAQQRGGSKRFDARHLVDRPRGVEHHGAIRIGLIQKLESAHVPDGFLIAQQEPPFPLAGRLECEPLR